ncbi:MAG: hypothetical protein COX38_01030 [Candidatus Nealsonbacteria bacterium CG23_combo_of_CG06-09_8_20_14_all_39_25]|uniref:Transglutaminase-like domain-containing protein n=4 Tax=Bacteria candidate phyla TaxID=1783234 RepID=A0A2G9YT00_9BACT|nr:MAG: hypothetical protein COX38_01030 [Candidatus Nealsonbacteria bacterium CG23_combo_of_CG06-09_8_20_14_all_39_25]PIQ98642.1 MAG: hypothetical protein COV64_00135 [Candidatus Nealsonbacteria bacterium CG11_big_fil_rev_8_21_14_0_20_39_9]PIZ88284.1 MAG: hypothetical protein COX91_00985 [Candidatus Nealsonbacteria bacterium CG_4_10_14_0_2_um_filter_39_15]PJC68656.1 MAG: hypothetical protein CO015_03245 [candidate division WWE3 bacterium CG_4_8_14_3_um_filter_42_11]
MVDQATPKNNLQSLSLELTKEEKTEEDKIEKLYHFVKKRVKYKVTVLKGPEETLERGYGSCVDKSLLFTELLRFIGVKSRYRVVLVNLDRLIPKNFLVNFFLSRLKFPFYFHIFNEVYAGAEWKKMDTSLDGEIERYLQRKNFASGEKGCSIPAEYILEDLGSFDNLSDVFTTPFFIGLFGQGPSYKEKVQDGLNLCNWFLYMKRKNKTKGLAKKESIEDVLVNINKFKR